MEVSGTLAKSPSNPNSPVTSKSMKFFQKIGARRQKHDTSESTDPLLLSYNKNHDEEAPPGECEDVFELLPDDKKKKKRKSLLRRNKPLAGRTQSNPGEKISEKIKSSDSDDKIHARTNDDFNPWVNRALSDEMYAQRAAARSLDDLSAIPETNTNNNNTTQSLSHQHTSPTKIWGVTKKFRGKKTTSSLQVNKENVIVKSAPSTPEKHRKKHYSFPSVTGNTTPPKIIINTGLQDTITEIEQPVVTVKRRASSDTKHLHHNRHRSYDPEELQAMASHMIAAGKPSSDIVRTSSLNYGDKPHPYSARYRQQYPTSSPPIGSQRNFFSSSTMDSQESLNGVRSFLYSFVNKLMPYTSLNVFHYFYSHTWKVTLLKVVRTLKMNMVSFLL